MAHPEERALLEQYVAAGKLLQLATVSPQGVPAVCHVWYQASFRPDRLYFTSRQDREHSQNIRATGRVAGGIVHIPLEGLGQRVQGVTFKGTAAELPPQGIDAQLAAFLARWPQAASAINPELLAQGATPHRLYEVTVTAWVLFDEVHYPDQPRRAIPGAT